MSTKTLTTVTITHGDALDLRIDITNNLTGTKALGNYDVVVTDARGELGRFPVNGYERAWGMLPLIAKLLMAIDMQGVEGKDVTYGDAFPEPSGRKDHELMGEDQAALSRPHEGDKA